MKKFFLAKPLLYFIILLAFALRIYGLNWDQNQHLHPDERFLTMVGTAAKLPSSLPEYLDPASSTLNPYNVGFNFYVYGTFPITLNKILAVFSKLDNYNDFALLGRVLSALFDVGTLIVVYKIVELWEKRHAFDRRLKYLSAFLYAVAVLPIQLSHFFTVDAFLSFFMTVSLYFSLHFYYFGLARSLIGMAAFFGLALASKISALYILPLICVILVLRFIKVPRYLSVTTLASIVSGTGIFQIVKTFLIFVLIAYVAFRFADPKSFANGNFLDVGPNPLFMNGLDQVKVLSTQQARYFPPAVQWFDKTPVVFALQNIVFFGLGVPFFAFMLTGFFRFLTTKKFELVATALWVISFFVYQSTRFGHTMRYFLFLYPYFAIFAAFGLARLFGLKNKKVRLWSVGVTILLVLLWPLSFISIYARPHSRVQASYWIHQNIPEGSYIAGEHWDDGLPMQLPDIQNRSYKIVQMPVFGEDTQEKWQEMDQILDRADYIIFSSNRGYGSILPQPDMYPRMSRFYEDLFAGKLQFKKIKEFTSYPAFPPLCYTLHVTCYTFPDQWAEEAFTVYDHPKVIIFKKVHSAA